MLGFFEAHQNTDPTLRTFARNLQAGNDPKSFDSETIIRIKEGRGPPGGRCLDLGFVEVLVTGKYPESLVITRTNTESGGVKI